MRLPEYARRSRSVSTSIARSAVRIILPYSRRTLRDREWVALMLALSELIRPAREESSRIAREFFDAERRRQLPDEPRHDVLLQSHYVPLSLAAQVAEYREDLAGGRGPDDDTLRLAKQREASDAAVSKIAAVAVREVDNGGRATMLEATETDPRKPRFARVAGGSSSCAFCLTMISRGPVYHDEQSAGGVTAFHPNDDCRVVPVWDSNDWPGRAAFKAAEEQYKRASEQPGDTLRNLRRNLKND